LASAVAEHIIGEGRRMCAKEQGVVGGEETVTSRGRRWSPEVVFFFGEKEEKWKRSRGEGGGGGGGEEKVEKW
jgi:hypothetical protein